MVDKKFCPNCKNDKNIEDFPKNRSKKDGLASHCKECKKIIQNDWYKTHKKEHYQRNIKQKQKISSLLEEYLKDKKCIDCDNNNPWVLEFDHVKGKKRDNISSMVLNGLGWKTILLEINKCEIRCANCHRIITIKRRMASKL